MMCNKQFKFSGKKNHFELNWCKVGAVVVVATAAAAAATTIGVCLESLSIIKLSLGE